ncbi:unnamed protein product [Schistosoma margrebowiei]|uniref:Uncharacterized protein n=1 Tax=Schistosoma margrebowiei TaxID=48269 RepID=A0A183L9M1_9TREM|nr:unnamed protein product [Schistosoma margrebowiei]
MKLQKGVILYKFVQIWKESNEGGLVVQWWWWWWSLTVYTHLSVQLMIPTQTIVLRRQQVDSADKPNLVTLNNMVTGIRPYKVVVYRGHNIAEDQI